MRWVPFAFAAALCWGSYGPLLHEGQTALANPFRALLCVGVAYFLVGVLFPLAVLAGQGAIGGLNPAGVRSGLLAGTLGAVGAVCIVWAFRSGGTPVYVMPLVYAGAPIINVFVSMAMHPPKSRINPLLFVGILLASGGASMVLYFKPVE